MTIDVYKKELTLHVSDEELEKRKTQWKYESKVQEGYLARYAAQVRSADMGGILGWKN